MGEEYASDRLELCLKAELARLLVLQHDALYERLNRRLASAEASLLERLGGAHDGPQAAGLRSGGPQATGPHDGSSAPPVGQLRCTSVLTELSMARKERLLADLQEKRRLSLGSELLLRPSVLSTSASQGTVEGVLAQSLAQSEVAVGRLRSYGSDSGRPAHATTSGGTDGDGAAVVTISSAPSTTAEARHAGGGRGSSAEVEMLPKMPRPDNNLDFLFGFLIITNAMFIGIETDYGPKSQEAGTGYNIFQVFTIIYAILFTLELIFKIYKARMRFLTDLDWHWNVLDVFIVGTSWVEAGAIIALGLPNAQDPANNQSTAQFRILRIVRITRLVKVIRVTRIIRFIRALRTMVHQLLNTTKALLWGVTLLCLIIYLFATLFTQTVQLHLDDGGEVTDKLHNIWGTIPRSMFTLFQTCTGGVNWYEVANPLFEISAFAVLLFIVYVAFVQFAVLNILTGVFCQNAIDSALHDQELVAQDLLANKQTYVRNIQKLFKDFDKDNDGSISIGEFMEHLDDERVRAYFESLEMDTTDIGTLFRLLNTNDQNELELDEFVQGCMRLKGNAKGIDLAKLNYAHSALGRRLARFIDRTDRALEYLLEKEALSPEADLGLSTESLGIKRVGTSCMMAPSLVADDAAAAAASVGTVTAAAVATPLLRALPLQPLAETGGDGSRLYL